MMNIQPNLQNAYFDRESMPKSSRFSREANSVSGGWVGWGDGHPEEDVLSSRPSRVRSFVRTRLPFAPRPGTTLILNKEKRINPMRVVPEMSLAHRLRILMALRVFYDTIRDELGSNVDLLCWLGGRTMQPTLSDLDRFRLEHFEMACATGVLASCNGVVVRCYPKGNSSDDQWWKLRSYIANNYRAYRDIGERYYGPGFRVMTQLSFMTFGDGASVQLTAQELAELVGWCEEAGCDDVGIWAAGMEVRPGDRDLGGILRELDERLEERSPRLGRNGANT